MKQRIWFAILVLMILLPATLHTARAADRVSIVERPDNEYLILGVTINGYSREDGIDAYLPEDAATEDTLLPLGVISNAMTFAIQVNPGDGTAEGWFIKDDKTFQLDLTTQQAFVAGKLRRLAREDAEAHVDDIYVRAQLLEEWFGLDITIDLNALLAEIETDAPLPFLEQMDRRKRADNVLNSFSYDAGLKLEDAYVLPYRVFTTPSILLSQDFLTLTQPGSQRYQSISTVQANMELFKFGADLNMAYIQDTGGDNDITTARMTFQRRDPGRRLLGPLRTGKVEFGDINFPSAPLLIGSKQGTGIGISSDPELGFRFARDASDFTLEGDAPIGWDAELYRNGNYIDFQTVGADGQFRFEEAGLLDGFNQFQIVLYGPEGQKRTVTRDVYRGPNMLHAGELVYDMAMGMPQKDFLPLAKGRQSDSTYGMSGQVFYGITENLTAGASAYAGPDDDEQSQGATFTLASSFLGLNTQLQAAVADEGRSAYEASVRLRPMGLNVSATHTVFRNFTADDQDLKSRTNLTLARNLGPLNITLSGTNRRFLDREKEFVLENLVSTDIFGAKLTNQLTRTFAHSDSIDDFKGELSLATNILDSRVRGSLAYDLDPQATNTFRNARLSANKKLSKKDNLRLNASYEFATDVVGGDARYTHQFGAVSMDLNAAASTDRNYSVGVGLRVGLQPASDGLYQMIEPDKSAQARLKLRAYIDKNDNDRFDEGDEPLNGVGFAASRGNAKAVTDDEGIAKMFGLVETPTTISINAEKIPSIYLVPKNPSRYLIPRRGADAMVDFAFVQLGEIDGFVYGRTTPDGAADEPMGNVPVRLIDTATGEEVHAAETEYDGYYVFTGLPLGTYKVVTSLGWFDEGEADTVSRTITLTSDAPTLMDQDLNLPYVAIPDMDMDAEEDEDTATVPAEPAEPVSAPAEDQKDAAGGYMIHIASYKSRETAETELKKLENTYPTLFNTGDLQVIVFEAGPGDVYFRIVGQPATKSDALQKCARIEKTVPDGCRVLAYQPAE